jgi:hypothetical protein
MSLANVSKELNAFIFRTETNVFHNNLLKEYPAFTFWVEEAVFLINVSEEYCTSVFMVEGSILRFFLTKISEDFISIFYVESSGFLNNCFGEIFPPSSGNFV